jgi:hypothetical protein
MRPDQREPEGKGADSAPEPPHAESPNEVARIRAERDEERRARIELKRRLEAEQDTWSERRAAWAIRIGQLEQEVAVLQAATESLAILESDLAATHVKLDKLLKSTSWRITAPLRWLVVRLSGRRSAMQSISSAPAVMPSDGQSRGTSPSERREAQLAGKGLHILAISAASSLITDVLLRIPLDYMARGMNISYVLAAYEDKGHLPLKRPPDLVLVVGPCSRGLSQFIATAHADGIPVILFDPSSLPGGDAQRADGQNREATENAFSSFDMVLALPGSIPADIHLPAPETRAVTILAGVELVDALPANADESRRQELRIGLAMVPADAPPPEGVVSALRELLDQSSPILYVETIGHKLTTLESHPRYRHFQAPDTLEPYLTLLHERAWDIGIMPSDGQAAPLQAELIYRLYAASGISAVCVASSWTRRLIRDGQNGMLVNSDGELSTVLRRLNDDTSRRRELSRNARADARVNFSLPRVSCEYWSAFQRALRGAAIVLLQEESDMIREDHSLFGLYRRGFVRVRTRDPITLRDEDLSWAQALFVRDARGRSITHLVRRARMRGLKVIVSMETKLMSLLPRQGNWLARPVGPMLPPDLLDLIEESDLVVTSEPRIADLAAKYCRRVAVVPTSLATERTGRPLGETNGNATEAWLEVFRCAGLSMPRDAG